MRGQALVAVAVALPVLLGMGGLAVDMGRLYAAQARLQAAVDAAALAGSLHLVDDPDLVNGIVSNAVTEYLVTNYPEAFVTDISPGPEVRSVCVAAQVDVPMMFMGALGISSRSVSASACAGFNDLEVVLVIDNTGSMRGEPIRRVRRAAKKLVDLMMPSGGAPSVKVGLVPFRSKVRIDDWADGLSPGCRNADGTRNPYWESCFDALPPILGLSYNKRQIKRAINQMDAQGMGSGTIIAEGIKWGRHVLTPEYPYEQGGPSSQFRKVMILLTDGDNEDGTCGGPYAWDPRKDPRSPYRRNAYWGQSPPVTDCTCEDFGCLDQEMLRQATIAKEDYGLEIFVIRYGNSDYVDIQLLQSVASSTPGTDDHYFDAPTPRDIEEMFDQIGRQLGFRLL